MNLTNSRFEGTIVSGRIEGEGKYFFPNGNVYVGEFLDGAFHGQGTLFIPSIGRFVAEWDKGVPRNGVYSSRDGLVYQSPSENWLYATAEDRRFYTEHLNGLQPAGLSQLVDEEPPREVPVGCYDTGYGYFNKELGMLYQYDGTLIRAAELDEVKWIPVHCRRGGGAGDPPAKDAPKDGGPSKGGIRGGPPQLSHYPMDTTGKKPVKNVRHPKEMRAGEPKEVLARLVQAAKALDGPTFLGLFGDKDVSVVTMGLLSALQNAAMATRGDTRKALIAELQRICAEFGCIQDQIPRHVQKNEVVTQRIVDAVFSAQAQTTIGALTTELLKALAGAPALPNQASAPLQDVRIDGSSATAFMNRRVVHFGLNKLGTWVLKADLSYLQNWNPHF